MPIHGLWCKRWTTSGETANHFLKSLLCANVGDDREDHNSNERWFMEVLAVGDDSFESNGCTVASGIVHAALQARSAHEGFYRVDWDP